MQAFDTAGVTGIVWRRVLSGKEEPAEAVMHEIMILARKAEGFLGAEIFPPIPRVQDAYVVLYRFDRGNHLRQWLASSQRKELLAQMADLLVEPEVEFFFAHGRHEAGSASSVFAYRIRSDQEAAFQDWRRRILNEVRTWQGFLGTESFDTLDDGDPECIVVVRFDSRKALDAWLASSERKKYLSEAEAYVHHYSLRRIGSGFEGWFDVSTNSDPPPRWRQAMVILSALFPVIMIMRQLLSPIFEMFPMPVAYLILLILDLAVLTYAIMPHYSRLMHFWLHPTAHFSARREFAGWSIILAIIGVTLTILLAGF